MKRRNIAGRESECPIRLQHTPRLSETPYMKLSRRTRTRLQSLRDWCLLLVILAGVFSVFGFVYSRRNVHRVRVQPGHTTRLKVELAMQKDWRSKSFVKETGLPVRCRVISPGVSDQISVTVLSTGHGLHMLWAELEILAYSDAKRGTRERRLDFTINGKGDWPQATVIVEVP